MFWLFWPKTLWIEGRTPAAKSRLFRSLWQWQGRSDAFQIAAVANSSLVFEVKLRSRMRGDQLSASHITGKAGANSSARQSCQGCWPSTDRIKG